MHKTVFLLFAMLQFTVAGLAQSGSIRIPAYEDDYSRFVQQLESGETAINYTTFRDSYLKSNAFSQKGTKYDSLKGAVYKAIKAKRYEDVITLTQGMLSLDYTSMFAHMYLQKTYNILGDTINRNKYKAIEFGLIYSITKSGDGKTCETGWHVTQVEEEYFIIGTVLDAEFQGQSIATGGGNTCDRMTIKTEDKQSKTYYFEVNKVFEQYDKAFKK